MRRKSLLLIIILIGLLNSCCMKIVRLDGEEYILRKNYRVKIQDKNWRTEKTYISSGDIRYTNSNNFCQIKIYSSKLIGRDKKLSIETLSARQIYSIGIFKWQEMSPTKEIKK